ncbi:hypothetical protein IE81DRAFT_320162 [Ceraceosorus guamensis]|uniref:Uncharacterized protein n=1 Tax=Ceraceosorus guamensis TaxID=1522189 RepID=A0A316W690_9BASI|nr:hypothetical protein IE81DRAFT_320162 [Ceraceosorus guamensis]PWN45407.1 hypothetical protein IE81DRAFT_320162 [Ceraceosorus guamensis]
MWLLCPTRLARVVPSHPLNVRSFDSNFASWSSATEDLRVTRSLIQREFERSWPRPQLARTVSTVAMAVQSTHPSI